MYRIIWQDKTGNMRQVDCKGADLIRVKRKIQELGGIVVRTEFIQK